MNICLIHSQAMTYADPSHPSPEQEVVARAAAQLYKQQKVDRLLIVVNTVIKGYKECDVLKARLLQLGVPEDVIVVDPLADTTDGEFEIFKHYMSDHESAHAAVISIEAKRGRMEAIERREEFYPKIYWAEDVLAASGDAEFVHAWRSSFRHFKFRIWLGILPLIAMKVDPHAQLQRKLARLIRHQA